MQRGWFSSGRLRSAAWPSHSTNADLVALRRGYTRSVTGSWSRAIELTLAWPVQVGWKHEGAVAMLEERRKVKSAKFYESKMKMYALKAKAAASVK